LSCAKGNSWHQARTNELLVDIVKKVKRGELKQDPRHITELLN